MIILIFITGLVLLSADLRGCVQKSQCVSEPLNMDLSLATKGIAAIGVIFTHTMGVSLGYLCVALFFFWSGYGMTRNAEKKPFYLKTFWKNRPVKLFVPYITAAVFYHAVKKLLGAGGSFKGFIGSVLKSEELVDNSWYVWALLIFMVIFFFWSKMRFSSEKLKFAALCVFVILFSVFEFFYGRSGYLYWTYSNLAFLAGCAIWIFDREMKYRKWYLLSIPIIGFVAYAATPGFQRVFGYYSDTVRVISNNGVSTCAVLLALTVLAYIGKTNSIAKFLGKYSYEIYLIHGLIIILVKAANITTNLWVSTLIVIGASIGVSVPLHFLNQKIEATILSVKKV